MKRKKTRKHFWYRWLALSLLALTLYVVGYKAYWLRVKKHEEETRFREAIIQEGCLKNAHLQADQEARRKGFLPNSDAYFVVYELTRQRLNSECLTRQGLPTKEGNSWNFDWLPNASPTPHK